MRIRGAEFAVAGPCLWAQGILDIVVLRFGDNDQIVFEGAGYGDGVGAIGAGSGLVADLGFGIVEHGDFDIVSG